MIRALLRLISSYIFSQLFFRFTKAEHTIYYKIVLGIGGFTIHILGHLQLAVLKRK